MKLLGTGLSGMVGAAVVDALSPTYEFENLSLETGVDITNKETLETRIAQTAAPWILHFAAITDVDAAEKDRSLKEKSLTWNVNVLATENIVFCCQKYKKRLLYISTDFVFPGGEKVFTEEDMPNPVGWYAITKYEGGKRVAALGDSGLIVRLSFPYGPQKSVKPDFVRRIRNRFEEKQEIAAPKDQLFTPTYIEDIATAIQSLIEQSGSGIYHAVGSQQVSGYEAAPLIGKTFGYDTSLVKETTAEAFFQGRAPRAFQLRISNAKIAKRGVTLRTFEEGLRHIQKREEEKGI